MSPMSVVLAFFIVFALLFLIADFIHAKTYFIKWTSGLLRDRYVHHRTSTISNWKPYPIYSFVGMNDVRVNIKDYLLGYVFVKEVVLGYRTLKENSRGIRKYKDVPGFIIHTGSVERPFIFITGKEPIMAATIAFQNGYTTLFEHEPNESQIEVLKILESCCPNGYPTFQYRNKEHYIERQQIVKHEVFK